MASHGPTSAGRQLGMSVVKKIIASIRKNARESVRVEITEFKGHNLVDLRVYADGDDGQVPTKKGITVRVGLLPDLIEGLKKAETAPRSQGLLDGNG